MLPVEVFVTKAKTLIGKSMLDARHRSFPSEAHDRLIYSSSKVKLQPHIL